MVNKDKDLIFANFKVKVQSFKDFNNMQELLIMNLVSSFS